MIRLTKYKILEHFGKLKSHNFKMFLIKHSLGEGGGNKCTWEKLKLVLINIQDITNIQEDYTVKIGGFGYFNNVMHRVRRVSKNIYIWKVSGKFMYRKNEQTNKKKIKTDKDKTEEKTHPHKKI